LGVLVPRVCSMEESLLAILMNIQTLFNQTNFYYQTYTKSTIYIL
jgi:hypothetical protein